ncbi:MAG: glycosyltransferase [Ignavibacteriales bacterium]|nr:glycosyltransferase [Ignavibacteriales bacterium]
MTKSMKIGIDFRELVKGKTTGIGRFLLNFLDYATQADDDNIYYLYGNQFTDFRLVNDRTTIRIIHERNTLYWDQVKLPKEIRKDSIDIFFSPYDKLPVSLKIPKVLTIHDLLFVFLDNVGYRKRFLYNKLYLAYRRQMAYSANRIVTVSEYSKNDILKLWGLPEGTISVIHNGISSRFRKIEIKTEDRQLFLNRFSIVKPFILYVGNFMPHKNVLSLIHAYSQLPANYINDYQLVLCGKKDKHANQLQSQIEKINLQNHAIFTNNVDDDELLKLFNLADLFIFPSFYEGFGLPPLEAMACGTPVISSNSSSLPEVLGNAPLYINPDDSQKISDRITEVLNSKSLQNDLIRKGFKQAKQFQLQDTSRQLLNAITELLPLESQSHSTFVKYKSTESSAHVDIIKNSEKIPKASVIIPTIDGCREGYLPDLLKQIKNQTFQDFELIIITGDTRQGRAINKGVQKCQGKIIIILDDDTKIGHNDLFARLITALDSDSTIGMVGVPNLIPENAPPLVKSFMSQIPRRNSPMVSRITESDLAEHPCCAIQKKVFMEVGGENELIPRGVDPYLRKVIRDAGYKVVVIPEVFIHHLPSKSLSENCKKFFQNGKMAAYVNKFFPQFVIELPQKHNQKVQKKRSYIHRSISYQFRLVKSLLTQNYIYLLSLIFYLFGFIWGFIFYRKDSV